MMHFGAPVRRLCGWAGYWGSGATHAGNAAGASKPYMQGKNLSPLCHGSQHLPNTEGMSGKASMDWRWAV